MKTDYNPEADEINDEDLEAAADFYDQLSEPVQCECVPGVFLCKIAVALWDEVNKAYHRSARRGYDRASWFNYTQAMEEYGKHQKEEI